MSLAEAQASQDKAHLQVIEACKELERKILATDDALLLKSLELEAVIKTHEDDIREMATLMNRKVQAHKERVQQEQGELDRRRRENEGLRRHLKRLVQLQRTLAVPIFSPDGGDTSFGKDPTVTEEDALEAEKDKVMVARVASAHLDDVFLLNSDDSTEEEITGVNDVSQEGEVLSIEQCKKRRKACGPIVIPCGPVSDSTTLLSVGSSPVKSSLESASSKRPRSFMELIAEQSGAAAPEVVNAGPIDAAPGDCATGKVCARAGPWETPRRLAVSDVCLLEGTHFQVSSDKFKGAPPTDEISPSHDSQAQKSLQSASQALANPAQGGMQVYEYVPEDSKEEPDKENGGTWKEITENDVRLYVCKLGSNHNCNQKFIDLKSLTTHRKEYHRSEAWQILGQRGRHPKRMPRLGGRTGVDADPDKQNPSKKELQVVKKVNSRKRRKAQIQPFCLKRKQVREQEPEVRQRENYAASKARFMLTMSSRIEREMRETEYPEKQALEPCHSTLPVLLAVTEPADFELQGWDDEQGLDSGSFSRVFSNFSLGLVNRLKEKLKNSLATMHSGVKEGHKKCTEAKAVMKGRVRNPLQTTDSTPTRHAGDLKTPSQIRNEQEDMNTILSAFSKAKFRNDASVELRARLKKDIELYVRSSEARAAAIQDVQHLFRVRRARELFTDWELRYWRFQPPGELDPVSGPPGLDTANDALLQGGCSPRAVRILDVKQSPAVDKEAPAQSLDVVTLPTRQDLEGHSCEIFCKETGRWSPGDAVHYSPCDGKHLVVFRDGRIQCLTLAVAQNQPLAVHQQ